MFSLQFLPLADAVAIAFVMPFIMLILGKYVLDEGSNTAYDAVSVCRHNVSHTAELQIGAPPFRAVVAVDVFALYAGHPPGRKEDRPIAFAKCVSSVVAVALLTPFC
jgi:hypothetical protein